MRRASIEGKERRQCAWLDLSIGYFIAFAITLVLYVKRILQKHQTTHHRDTCTTRDRAKLVAIEPIVIPPPFRTSLSTLSAQAPDNCSLASCSFDAHINVFAVSLLMAEHGVGEQSSGTGKDTADEGAIWGGDDEVGSCDATFSRSCLEGLARDKGAVLRLHV
uniref:Uncharacterized protein n=1 Tax=Plectus sambesii TaxID=2011161 RepID=A0A914XJN4_9BILA